MNPCRAQPPRDAALRPGGRAPGEPEPRAPARRAWRPRLLLLLRCHAGAARHLAGDPERNRVTALIGPSGCGKSTFLRSINRMNDLIPARATRATSAATALRLRAGTWTWSACASGSGWCSRSRTRSRSRSTTTSRTGRGSTAWRAALRAGRDRGALAAPRRALGRGEGPAGPQRARALRRAAAAPLHRARARGSPRCC
jgi:hypothetical protein